jgi:hypothetical protein
MNGRVDERTNGLTDALMDGRVNGLKVHARTVGQRDGWRD